MEDDAFSRKDVIELVNRRFFAVQMNIVENEGFAKQYDLVASPGQGIFTVDGELVGRSSGYLNAFDEMRWIEAYVENRAKIPALKARLEEDGDDHVASVAMGLALTRCGLDVPARPYLRIPIARIPLKKDRTEAERRACAEACITLMDTQLHNVRPEPIKEPELTRMSATVREMDPDDKFGLLDDGAAFETLAHNAGKRSEEAVTCAKAARKRWPNGDRREMLLYHMAVGLYYSGKPKNDAALIAEAIQVAKDVQATGKGRYAENAGMLLDRIEKEKK